MREYSIQRAGTEPEWTHIPALSADIPLWRTKAEVSMLQKLCYDAEHLYVYQRAEEKNIRAQYTGLTDPVFNDSCMEFFLAPVQGDGRYINFEVNPNGAFNAGIGYGRGDRLRLLPRDGGKLFQIRTGYTTTGWEAYYCLPAAFMRTLYPAFKIFVPGMELRGNVYKCGDLTDHLHYLAWNPVTSDTPDYHRSCDFGRMILL